MKLRSHLLSFVTTALRNGLLGALDSRAACVLVATQAQAVNEMVEENGGAGFRRKTPAEWANAVVEHGEALYQRRRRECSS